ncbi:MAG: hypothetical protein EXS27_09925 [Pedosphaera sp.]|nr:hypothetical protein [Pedosphaera sp.]
MSQKLLLILCLVMNVAFGAMLLRSKPVEPPVALALAQTSAAPFVPATPAAAKTRTVTQVVTNTVAQKFDWNAVESDDYKKYIANLRSIGCPEETIRDIITADVNKLYDAKRKALAGPKKKYEFWKPGMTVGAPADPERTEKERALNKEKRVLLTELLGSAPEEKVDLLAGVASQLDAMFDFLPTEKRSKVMELMQDMQTKMQKAMENGAPDPEDMRKVMKDIETEIGRVLTPEELLDYNLRFSTTATMMRFQLSGFEPNEQEFLELYKKRKAYDDEFGGAFGAALNLKGEEKAKQDTAKKALEESVKAQLGDERYADYKRSEDFAYQAMFRAASREGLGKDAAVKAFDMKKVAEEQAGKIRSDKNLSSDQRTASLRGIRDETERSVKGVLGEKGFTSYERNNGAYWLKGIAPDAPTPTKQP